MPTHHGRPGGRLVELILAFIIIGISVALLLGGIAIPLILSVLLAKLFGPTFMIVFAGASITYLWRPAMRAAWWIAAAIWNPFLNYYGYEAHSLKPIKPKEEK